MSFCPRCGNEVREDWEFCSHCGKILKTVCAGCGKTAIGGLSYCPYCGRMLEQPAQQQFAAAPPPVVYEQKDSFGSLYPLLILGIVFIVAGLLFPLCIILGVLILILWLVIGVLS